MGKLKLRKPLAVVDCNFIQRCSSEHNDVPAHFDCLLIAPLFRELLSKKAEEREFLFNRFIEWTRRNVDRLWMMRELDDIRTELEGSTERVKRIHSYDLLSPFQTRILRRYVRDPNFRWSPSHSRPSVEKWLQEGTSACQDFVGFTDECRAFAESLEPVCKFITSVLFS